MVADKFRRQLRQEAELWRAEGVIDADIYEQLSERYQFNALEASARNRFVMILIGLGSILIGLGIITLVAANWQVLSREGKVTLLLSLFTGVNIAGYSLWRRPQTPQQRFGHGLLLLGALLLGANMGLMGQMFHIDKPFYELLLAWGVGVLAMAYSLRLTSLGVLSIILMGLGYWGFWWNWVQPNPSTSALIGEFSWSSVMGQHMPLWAGLMFVPLAYWCRSRAIFALAAIAVISSLEANLLFSFQPFDLFPFPTKGLVLAIAFALPPALLWGYDDSVWIYDDLPSLLDEEPAAAASSPPPGSFQPIARQVALVFLGILLYFSSYLWFWDLLSNLSVANPPGTNWFPLLDALILSGVAVFEWLRLTWQARNSRTHQGRNLTTIAIGAFILLTAAMPFWHINVAPIPMLATFIFNVLLFLFAVNFMREGLARGERQAFWGGLVLLTLRILSWFVLLNTGLMLKSLVFILCGFGAIAVGLWFERYVRTLGSTPKNS